MHMGYKEFDFTHLQLGMVFVIQSLFIFSVLVEMMDSELPPVDVIYKQFLDVVHDHDLALLLENIVVFGTMHKIV